MLAGFKVWLIRDGTECAYVGRFDERGRITEWTSADAGSDSEPTMLLGEHEARALVSALQGHLPASEPQAKHLDDAITVRDRLLTLVEASHERAR